MTFEDARTVEMITYQLKESDYIRGQNRARINDLFNGAPPYTQDEVEENDLKINVNDLEATRGAHHARAQYYSAFLKQDRFFSCRTDSGPRHKRSEYNTIVTAQAAKVMKKSLRYFECLRSKFALDVLHGIGPASWEDREMVFPDPVGVDDVLIPADTLLTMKNLPFFALYRSYTAPELIKLTTGPKVDNAWNMELVDRCVSWVDKEAQSLMGTNWPEVWSPEKIMERKKDTGYYAGDKVPTIDTFDFYYWSDTGRRSGWRRRIILDAWGQPEMTGGQYTIHRKNGEVYNQDMQFLYNPGERVYAEDLNQLVSFQFADLSAVGPFKYHSVRSYGFLMYAVCHLQNRLRCKFNESVFESLMQYFRIAGEDEAQRALKVELINRGFLDPTIKMVPASERWQVNANLVELGLQENRQIIQDASSSYSQQTNFSQDRTQKTKFQVMAELQSSTAMLSSGLLQAYAYQQFEYQEIFRRMLRPNSKDPAAREMRAACLRQGVPEKLLIPEAWELMPEQIMGAGNTSLQLVIAQQLLEMLPQYDPQARDAVFRDINFAITQDAAKVKLYCPENKNTISNSVHDAQVSLGSILNGQVVAPMAGQNSIEIIESWLKSMGTMVQEIMQAGGVPGSPEQLRGLQNLGQHIAQRIVLLAADENEKPRVKQYSDMLGKLMNEVKAFGQRLQEQMQQQSKQGGGIDPKDAAKVQGMLIQAQAKAKNQRESHAQRMAQRDLAFQIDLKHKQQTKQLEDQALDLKTAGEIRRNRMSAFSE